MCNIDVEKVVLKFFLDKHDSTDIPVIEGITPEIIAMTIRGLHEKKMIKAVDVAGDMSQFPEFIVSYVTQLGIDRLD